MSFSPSSLPAKSWKATKEAIKDAFRWRCVVCFQAHSPSNSSGLRVYHIDRDSKNRHKENLVTLCHRCHSRIDQEAQFYFNYHHTQPMLLPQMDYLEAMKELWYRGLQMDFFEVCEPDASGLSEDNDPGSNDSYEQLEFSWHTPYSA